MCENAYSEVCVWNREERNEKRREQFYSLSGLSQNRFQRDSGLQNLSNEEHHGKERPKRWYFSKGKCVT